MAKKNKYGIGLDDIKVGDVVLLAPKNTGSRWQSNQKIRAVVTAVGVKRRNACGWGGTDWVVDEGKGNFLIVDAQTGAYSQSERVCEEPPPKDDRYRRETYPAVKPARWFVSINRVTAVGEDAVDEEFHKVSLEALAALQNDSNHRISQEATDYAVDELERLGLELGTSYAGGYEVRTVVVDNLLTVLSDGDVSDSVRTIQKERDELFIKNIAARGGNEVTLDVPNGNGHQTEPVKARWTDDGVTLELV